jgi:glutamine synthetase
VAEEHLDLCIRYGIKMSGMNAEVAPGQWEFQVGPCEGIEAGDHMIAARYLLLKIAEAHNVGVSFHPKPVKGSDMNGSGCHTNFSTANMRTGGDGISGLDHIYAAIGRLKVKHEHHMAQYGEENDMRLTGANETESYDKFTHGIGDRGASVRIGNETLKKKCGYFEDRRPAANCDPYLVTQLLCSTCLAAD